MDEKRGLSEKEAEKQLQKNGTNEIRDFGKVSPLRILIRQIRSNFVVYLLFFALIISFLVGKDLTAYIILVVIIIVISTGFIQEFKAEKAVQALKNMLMPVSVVIREGKEKEILSSHIVPGDILILRNGEKIPADCVIIEEKDLLVNESVLTGESREVRKIKPKDLKNFKEENLIFMGSFIVNGKCTAKVINTGMSTKFGKIAGMISGAEKELPLQKKVNHIAKYMVLLGLSFAILTGAIMVLRAPSLNASVLIEALVIVIAVAVSSFPEGFPVVLITSLASGSFRMARKNAIVNRMSIIETLGETTVICSDKTGTITKGEMTVRKVFSDNREFSITGAGYEGTGEFIFSNRPALLKNEKTLLLLAKAGIICNDSKIYRSGEDNLYKINGVPTEAALLILGAKAGIFREDIEFQRQEEISFSSERKMMSVFVAEGKKKNIYAKGALEVLLKKCKYIQRESGIFRLLEKDRQKILDYNKKFTSKALRTLAFAYKNADNLKCKRKECFESDLVFLGLVGMEDPPRDEIKEALSVCRTAGINVKMITGDNKETAISIGREIGLGDGRVIEGEDLDRLSDHQLAKIVKNVVIFARVRPEHKLRIVKALKENNEVVTMTGDGVNDAPALKEAHIGVAMGKNGTDVSRSVADLTLKDDNFATIVDAIKEGRTIFTNIQKFSAYQISINIAQVSLIFVSILLGLPLPLIAIQILFMNLFSDELTAITLVFNPYSKDIMVHKPRKKSSIVTKPLFVLIAVSGLIMCAGALGTFYYLLTIGNSEAAARTMTFVLMVFFGITNAFNFRSFRKSSLTRSPFSNKPLILVSAFILLTTLLIVYLPFSNHIFETVPVKPVFLLFGALISLSIVFIFDILKYWNEKKHFWTEDMQHFETSKLRNLPEKSGKREINLPLSPVKTFQQQ